MWTLDSSLEDVPIPLVANRKDVETWRDLTLYISVQNLLLLSPVFVDKAQVWLTLGCHQGSMTMGPTC